MFWFLPQSGSSDASIETLGGELPLSSASIRPSATPTGHFASSLSFLQVCVFAIIFKLKVVLARTYLLIIWQFYDKIALKSEEICKLKYQLSSFNGFLNVEGSEIGLNDSVNMRLINPYDKKM